MPYRDRLRSLRLVDVDVGGDVHRVILGGVNPCPGETVRDRMHYLEDHADGLRRFLISEPFGYESMCVNLVMPASLPEASLGFVIMEVMGYPYYSGSNTIATATAILEGGLVPMTEGRQTLRLETPSGLITVEAENRGGRVVSVTTKGGAAFISAADQTVEVPGLGTVTYDLVWSGGFYVLVEAAALGHRVEQDDIGPMTRSADAIIREVQKDFSHTHPELGDVGLPRFLHFMGPAEPLPDGTIRAPSGTYGHPGVIWRCPTGTGTSARLALMAQRGEIDDGTVLETVSPYGNAFRGVITAHTTVGDRTAVDSTITAAPTVAAYMDLTINLDAAVLKDYALDDLLGGPPDARIHWAP